VIRSNNPAIDFEALRARVRATADRVRAASAGEQRRRDPDSLFASYRAANAYLDRADDFAYPQTRVPRRIAVLLQRFGRRPERVLLHFYNLALRPAREASAAQVSATRELVKAGHAMAKRLRELEQQLDELRKRE